MTFHECLQAAIDMTTHSLAIYEKVTIVYFSVIIIIFENVIVMTHDYPNSQLSKVVHSSYFI
jgi:hypothetical protein